MKNILIIILVSVGIGQNIGATDAVENVLDNLHLYASEANGKKYFDLFAKNAVFFGTDISERWDKKAFQKYGMARFASGTGWTYFMKDRC